MSTGIKTGVSSYVSNLAQEGIVLLECVPYKTYVTVLFIVPVWSSSNSSGWITPPFYLSQTNCMALRNIPFRMRFENIVWRSYTVWIPQAFPRYPIAELYVSFTRLSIFPVDLQTYYSDNPPRFALRYNHAARIPKKKSLLAPAENKQIRRNFLQKQIINLNCLH